MSWVFRLNYKASPEECWKSERGCVQQKDPYRNYYRSTFVGQHLPSASMAKLSKFFREREANRILDFYCGMGRNSLLLAQHGFDVYAFDRSKMAVKELKSKRGAKKIHLRLLDLKSKLPYRNNFFDAVIIIRALYQAKISKIKKDIKEIDRVTRHGGYIYIESDQQYTWRRKVLYGQHKTGERGTYRHGKDGDYYHYFTKEELRTLFASYKALRFHFKNRRFYALFQKP